MLTGRTKSLLLLILVCLFASPALADDTITSWTWSSVTGTFQAKLAALGWKNIPDISAGSFTITWTGPRSSTSTATYYKVGKSVTVNVPSNSAATCSSATVFSGATSTASWPSILWPAVSTSTLFFIQDNSAGQTTPGYIVANTNGSFEVDKNATPGNFTASGTCGWGGAVSITYVTN